MRKVRERSPTIKNKLYCEFLYAINIENISATEIHEKTHRDISNIVKQMRILKKEGFVELREHPKRERNKKLYSINWEKVNFEFLNFLDRKKAEVLKGVARIFKKTEVEKLSNQHPLMELKLLTPEYVQRMSKNKYLIEFFKSIFRELQKKEYETPTIEEIFVFLLYNVRNFSYLDIEYFTNKKLEDKHGIREFKTEGQMKEYWKKRKELDKLIEESGIKKSEEYLDIKQLIPICRSCSANPNVVIPIQLAQDKIINATTEKF